MTPSQQIDQRIAETGGWRGELYARLRALINETAPELSEAWKWDTAVWQLKTNVLAVSAFKDHVKINFFNGVDLDDPDHLFNNGLESKRNRSIDFAQDSQLDAKKLQALIRQAIAASKH